MMKTFSTLLIGAMITALALVSPTMAQSPESEKTWKFGSGQGRDGNGSFVLINTSRTNGQWSVEENSLRFQNKFLSQGSDENNNTDAGAVVDLTAHGWQPGQDFSLILEMEIRGMGEWNRVGVVAFAPAMKDHKYQNKGFYHSQICVVGRRAYHLRFSDGFIGNHPLTFPMGTTPASGTFSDGVYKLVLSGAYDKHGTLRLHSRLERDGEEPIYAMTQEFRSSRQFKGTHFGFGGTFRAFDKFQPVIDFRSLSYVPRAMDAPGVTQDPVKGEGEWSWKGKTYPFKTTVLQSAYQYEPLPTVVYMKGLDIPRIGTDSDEAIVSDLLKDGLLVVELDATGLTSESPEMEEAIQDFHRNLPIHVAGANQGKVQVDTAYLYTLPSGYRLARNLPYWNIEKHGVNGTLNRVLDIYNTRVVRDFGIEPVNSIDAMRGRDGDAFDYNLYIDMIYPSGTPENKVPLIAHFATIDQMPLMFRAMKRRLYPIGWVTSGYAVALVDHVYHPAARVRYYGHFGPFTLDPWNGLAAGTAAIRFFRAHADQFNINERIGALGHSKSSYTVMRLADPDHVGQKEHSTFSNFTPGTAEPQPWPGHDSHIHVAYASMGLGIDWTKYTKQEMVPLVVAAGRHDQFRFWDKTPVQVERARKFDLNQLSLWMENIGHTFPQDVDYPTGIDATLLVRRFFDQHLHPRGDKSLNVHSVIPADGKQDVELNGTIPRFDVPREQYPKDLRGMQPVIPITVRFARSIDVEALAEDALQVIEMGGRETVVPGTWTPSMRNSQFVFTPKESLKPATQYRVKINAGIRDIQGQTLDQAHQQTFHTRKK